MENVRAYGARTAVDRLAPMTIERRAPRELDVSIDVLFCGVCHSDIHQVRDEWSGGLFPMVPGHEIVGRVSAVGSSVTKFAVGDLVGVGCMVDSCRRCPSCEIGDEQLCERGHAPTYNGTEMDRRTPTFGGYSAHVVVDEAFVLSIPPGLDPAAAAPLLCAGITTYSPLRRFGCREGQRVGVVGLGGLGHMAVKLARSMGADVTVFSSSPSKEADARALGATDFVVSSDRAQMKAIANKLDLIVDTVSAEHDYNALLKALRPRGTMILVGAPATPSLIRSFSLITGAKQLVGSLIGGIAETQEMLDHCGAHGIVSDIELVDIKDIEATYERVLKSQVRYRAVIDMATLTR